MEKIVKENEENQETVYYPGDFEMKKKEYMKMTPEQRKALNTRGDAIDEIDIFNLEDKDGPQFVVEEEDDMFDTENMGEDPWEFIERH